MVMNFIRKLMYGRYGSDQLSFFLLVVYIVLILLSGLPHLEVLSWLALALRTVSAGAPGEGEDHRQLPQLRRQL